jgi:hypothetical protein
MTRAIVVKRAPKLGRRGKCEALAMAREYRCVHCGKQTRVVWREWYGWKVTPAVCTECCKELFDAIERG